VIAAFNAADSQAFLMRAAGQIEDLPAGDLLTVVEFATDGVLVWEVDIDEAGTPRADALRAAWGEFRSVDDGLDPDRLLTFTEPRNPARVMLACTSDDPDYVRRAYRVFRDRYQDAWAYQWTPGPSAEELLDEAISHARLRQMYGLVVLRRTAAGKLEPVVEKLFSSGIARGARPQKLRIRIEPAGVPGTTLAVLASDEDDHPPQYRQVSLGSVTIPPGTYTLSAALLRPGGIRFEIDDRVLWLRPDERTLSEILAIAPRRLMRLARSHLVIAIETCGPAEAFNQRIAVARQLVAAAADGADEPTSYSLVGYAGHTHNQYTRIGDQPVDALAWARDAREIGMAIDHLDNHGAAPGSPPAAQLECALACISSRLGDARNDAKWGRPVVVTIGTREPYPPYEDLRSPLLPCPARNDWLRIRSRLAERHPGITFGAIHDSDPRLEVWKLLGEQATGQLAGDADAWDFAAKLALISSAAQAVPLPVMDTGGR
jgi:hypothetical protein